MRSPAPLSKGGDFGRLGVRGSIIRVLTVSTRTSCVQSSKSRVFTISGEKRNSSSGNLTILALFGRCLLSGDRADEPYGTVPYSRIKNRDRVSAYETTTTKTGQIPALPWTLPPEREELKLSRRTYRYPPPF